MEAKDLRIGDLIYAENEIVEVNYLTPYSIGYGNGNFAPNTFNIFQPIPLTEDWLVRFGFEKEYSDYYLLIGKARIIFKYYGGLAHQLDIIQDGRHISMHIGCTKYVHELQNLYFALTGKELALKN